jgi:hypothetical protein
MTETKPRDTAAMAHLYARGYSLRAIGRRFGISGARVGQLLAHGHPAVLRAGAVGKKRKQPVSLAPMPWDKRA